MELGLEGVTSVKCKNNYTYSSNKNVFLFHESNGSTDSFTYFCWLQFISDSFQQFISRLVCKVIFVLVIKKKKITFAVCEYNCFKIRQNIFEIHREIQRSIKNFTYYHYLNATHLITQVINKTNLDFVRWVHGRIIIDFLGDKLFNSLLEIEFLGVPFYIKDIRMHSVWVRFCYKINKRTMTGFLRLIR